MCNEDKELAALYLLSQEETRVDFENTNAFSNMASSICVVVIFVVFLIYIKTLIFG